jgi:chromosome partitioning protein
MVGAGGYDVPAVTKASSGGNPASRTPPARSTPNGPAAPRPKRQARAQTPRPPETPGIARIIAIANQKGGVGKSTTAVSLGAALAHIGYRVLVVDLDPQGNASTGMGIRHEAREYTVYDVIVAEAPVTDAVVATPVERLFAIPSTIDLAGAEIELVSQFSREARLKKALAPIREGAYDFVLLDCPPSLGLLTINALTAAEELIVPIQCEYYALEGLGQLLRNVSLVQQNINPELRLTGIVMTMFDPRTKLSEQVVAEVKKFFGDLVYDVIIPRTVRLSEAPGFGQPITVYDPKSKGAESYRELAREVALRPPPAEPMPVFGDLPTVVLPSIDNSPSPLRSEEAVLDELPTVRAVLEDSSWTPRGASAAEEELEAVTVADNVTETPASSEEDSEQSEEVEGSVPSGAELEAQTWLEELGAESGSEAPSTGDVLSDAVAHVVEQLDDDDLWEDAPEPRTSEARVSAPRSPAPPGHLPQHRVVVIDDDDVVAPVPEAEEPGEADAAGIGATLENEDPSRRRRWRLFRKGGE